MRQILFTIVILCFNLFSSASINTIFSANNKIERPNRTVSLHSLKIFEDCAIVTIKIVPKQDFERLNFWSSKNTVLKVGNSELSIVGFKINGIDGSSFYSSAPFDGTWGWDDLKKGKSHYYSMKFKGKLPPGIFKISLIDYGDDEGNHGYNFRNQIINNAPLSDYDFSSNPIRSTYFTDEKSIETDDKSYTASLQSVKIYSNFTTATIKLVPNVDIESLPLYQSEKTILKTKDSSYPIQGFLGDFYETKDSILNPLVFNGTWNWKKAKAGEEYYYTMVFDGKLRQGFESISIIDEGNDNGMHGFSFKDVSIDNPVTFKWNHLDEYVIYHFNRLLDYILRQPLFLSWLYLFILLSTVGIPLIIAFRALIKLICKVQIRIEETWQVKKKQTKYYRNKILKEKDEIYLVGVLDVSGDTAEFKTQKLIKKVRLYNGRYIQYYSTGDYYSEVYLHPGDYLYKVVLSYIEIKGRCSSSSIKAAFSRCPALREQLNRFLKGESSYWVYVKWFDGQDTVCLRKPFNFFEIRTYLHGQDELKRISADVHKIQTSLLKEKLSWEKAVKNGLKWIGKGLVKVFAASVFGYIGASLPDFDFDMDIDTPSSDLGLGLDIPEFDNEMDFDINSDYDSGDFNSYPDDESGYNVAFGSQNASLNRCGGSSDSLPVTITKVPGTANEFSIKDQFGHVVKVKGTDNKVDINGIWYKLPKLKG